MHNKKQHNVLKRQPACPNQPSKSVMTLAALEISVFDFDFHTRFVRRHPGEGNLLHAANSIHHQSAGMDDYPHRVSLTNNKTDLHVLINRIDILRLP